MPMYRSPYLLIASSLFYACRLSIDRAYTTGCIPHQVATVPLKHPALRLWVLTTEPEQATQLAETRPVHVGPRRHCCLEPCRGGNPPTPRAPRGIQQPSQATGETKCGR